MADKNLNEIIIALSGQPGICVFRNNVGVGWVGRREKTPGRSSIILHNPRPLHAGLHKGSHDLIGWRTVTVTPDMVGRQVAVFVSVDAKAARDTLKKEQRTWRDNVLAAGGLAGAARSVDEALEVALAEVGVYSGCG